MPKFKLKSILKSKDDKLISQIAKGNANKVSKLISKGANVNKTGDHGWTPLHEGCQNGHFDIVALLLEKGANPDKKNNDYETPLHIAARSDKSKIDLMKLLIDKGANVNSRTKTLNTPLHYAALKDCVYHIMLLLSEGADADAQNSKGETAIHYAKDTNIQNFLNYHLQQKKMVNDSVVDNMAGGKSATNNYDDNDIEEKKNLNKFKIDEVMVVDPTKFSDSDDDVYSLDTTTTASTRSSISQGIESNDESEFQNPATPTRRDEYEEKNEEGYRARKHRRPQKCTKNNELVVRYSSTRIQDIKSKLRSIEYQYGRSYGLYSSTRVLEIKSKLRSMEYQYGRSIGL